MAVLRSRRVDVESLPACTRRADGTVVTEGRVGRTGVLVYRFADGSIRREYRPPEEAFAPASLASLRLRPLTNDHPSEGVTAANARTVTIGAIGENVRRDGEWIVTPIALYDESAIEDADAGKVQLSCGYDATLELTPGTSPDGEEYDAIQRSIIYNHVALVDVARAGDMACLRMDHRDSADGATVGVLVSRVAADRGAHATTCACRQCMQGSSQMPDPTKNPQPHMDQTAALAAIGAELDALKIKLATAEVDLATERHRADTTEGARIEAVRALGEATERLAAGASAVETAALIKERTRADAAEATVAQFDSRFENAVRSRAALERRAGIVIAPTVRLDRMSDHEIRVLVVKSLDPKADTNVAPGVIEGRFDALLDAHTVTAVDMARAAAVSQNVVRVDMHDTYAGAKRDAWRKPLPSASLK